MDGFNPNPSQQAKELWYSHKATKVIASVLIFIAYMVQNSPNRKLFGLVLD